MYVPPRQAACDARRTMPWDRSYHTTRPFSQPGAALACSHRAPLVRRSQASIADDPRNTLVGRFLGASGSPWGSGGPMEHSPDAIRCPCAPCGSDGRICELRSRALPTLDSMVARHGTRLLEGGFGAWVASLEAAKGFGTARRCSLEWKPKPRGIPGWG